MTTQTLPVAPQSTQQRRHRTFTPRVDLLSSDDALLLVADLPGVQPDQLGIEVDRGVLKLSAIRSPGVRYQRALRLPEGIDVDHIEASLDHGVLTLRLPKNAAHQPRRITINAE